MARDSFEYRYRAGTPPEAILKVPFGYQNVAARPELTTLRKLR